jgi:hypothetical protein
VMAPRGGSPGRMPHMVMGMRAADDPRATRARVSVAANFTSAKASAPRRADAQGGVSCT